LPAPSPTIPSEGIPGSSTDLEVLPSPPHCVHRIFVNVVYHLLSHHGEYQEDHTKAATPTGNLPAFPSPTHNDQPYNQAIHNPTTTTKSCKHQPTAFEPSKANNQSRTRSTSQINHTNMCGYGAEILYTCGHTDKPVLTSHCRAYLRECAQARAKGQVEPGECNPPRNVSTTDKNEKCRDCWPNRHGRRVLHPSGNSRGYGGRGSDG